MHQDLLSTNAAITYKDIFSIPNSVIGHVCNVAGGFGSGFAAAINEKSSKPKREYLGLYNAHGANLLGKASQHIDNKLHIVKIGRAHV